LELIQKSKGGIIAALFKFYNIPVSSLPPQPQDNSRRRQPHGISSALVHIPERTKHSRRRAAENTARNSRSQTHRSHTQQQTATAPPYNQEARKRKRTRKRDGISSVYKTINDTHRADKEGQAPFLSALSVSMDP
jgi:hypothetical protein